MELIPLELVLRAWVEVLFGLFSWDTVLWHWSADPIRTNVWKKIVNKSDLGPPRFPYCDRVSEMWWVPRLSCWQAKLVITVVKVRLLKYSRTQTKEFHETYWRKRNQCVHLKLFCNECITFNADSGELKSLLLHAYTSLPAGHCTLSPNCSTSPNGPTSPNLTYALL